MRKVYCTITLCLCMGAAFAQNVANVNGKPISSKELMWFYKKNHFANANVAYKDLEHYLNQYIDYKLKVLDAKEMGLDRDTAYLREIKNYEAALATQKRTTRSNKELEMLKNEYREAALMFNVSEIKIWDKAKDDQERLEQEWITTLRKKYTVKINQNEVKKLAKLD